MSSFVLHLALPDAPVSKSHPRLSPRHVGEVTKNAWNEVTYVWTQKVGNQTIPFDESKVLVTPSDNWPQDSAFVRVLDSRQHPVRRSETWSGVEWGGGGVGGEGMHGLTPDRYRCYGAAGGTPANDRTEFSQHYTLVVRFPRGFSAPNVQWQRRQRRRRRHGNYTRRTVCGTA